MLLNSCSESPSYRKDAQLIVAAAANVQFAMDSLEVVFEKQSGLDIEVITGSSGKLMAQIQHGAPFDLLVSADMKYPQTLYEEGFAADTAQVYAYGALVIWTMKDLNLHRDVGLFLDSAITKIAIANPKNAPYGQQTIAMFQHYRMYERVTPKLVLGESIAQTNQYILSGSCDLGVTAKSVVLAPIMRGKGDWVEISPGAYQPIAQGVVTTKYGREKHPENSRAFYDFLFSKTGQGILRRFGYTLPEMTSPDLHKSGKPTN